MTLITAISNHNFGSSVRNFACKGTLEYPPHIYREQAIKTLSRSNPTTRIKCTVRYISLVSKRPDPTVDLTKTHWRLCSNERVLVVDAPPGTSDEHISIVQCLGATGIDGAIIVTTPQQVSLIDVRKEITFCKKVGVKVLGVVENMSGLCQPLKDFKFMRMTETGEHIDISEWVREYLREKAPGLQNLIACSEVFDSSSGGAEKMCREMDVPFLGKVPLDPQLCKAAEEGRSCFIDNKCQLSAPALKIIIEKLIENNGFSRMLVDSA